MKTIADVIEETKFSGIIFAAQVENECRRINKEFNLIENFKMRFGEIDYHFFPNIHEILVFKNHIIIEGKEKLKLLREVVR